MSERNRLPAVKAGAGEYLTKGQSRVSEKEEMADCIWQLQCEVDSLKRVIETGAIKETAAYQQLQYDTAKLRMANSFRVRAFEFLYNACIKACEVFTRLSIYLMEGQLNRLSKLKEHYPLAKDKSNE